MDKSVKNDSFVFIVGSPRSGTTVLGELLDKHPQVSQWYEPYFVWDREFRLAPHDERTAEDATQKVQKQILKDFGDYKKKKRCAVLIDKSPRNSLKIPFILKIFPEARFIHLLRDGRDVTLSIHKEWQRRRKILPNSNSRGQVDYLRAYRVLKNFLARQTYARDKLRALWFETHGHLFNQTRLLSRLRWNGEIGWGPRVKDWQTAYSQMSLLQFNAHQWQACVGAVKRDWKEIPQLNRLLIRYEDLIVNPNSQIDKIMKFIGFQNNREFTSAVPKLRADNYNKWKREFTPKQLAEIHPILTPALMEFGYAESEEWIRKS